MTDWTALAAPFDPTEIKERPGPGNRALHYVDARVVAQRLDDVLTPEGWSFTWTHLPGENIVHGHLEIGGVIREDAGYPNSDRDEEPMKAAVSDALKRCAVLFGVGRHLYDDNASHRTSPSRPAATPPPSRSVTPPRPHVVDTNVPDIEEPAWFPPIGSNEDETLCPIHNVKWAGAPGDYWHKDADGSYCRHPNNVRKQRAR